MELIVESVNEIKIVSQCLHTIFLEVQYPLEHQNKYFSTKIYHVILLQEKIHHLVALLCFFLDWNLKLKIQHGTL